MPSAARAFARGILSGLDGGTTFVVALLYPTSP